jgi:hypothetical protein
MIDKIKDWKTGIIVRRDTKTRVATKRFLYSFDVERVSHSFVATWSGFDLYVDVYVLNFHYFEYNGVV